MKHAQLSRQPLCQTRRTRSVGGGQSGGARNKTN